MMIDPLRLLTILKGHGIEYFVGVPDSLLKNFCECINGNVDGNRHVICANEGNAIGLAAGWYLGTGRPALVYMQNSGIGNSINPLMSLADPEVYGLPMLLVVGWRGAPGSRDEPQHLKQGRIMQRLLDALEIPYFVLDDTVIDLDGLMCRAVEVMHLRMTPVAVLVQPNTFKSCGHFPRQAGEYPMSREEAIRLIVDSLGPGDLVVSTTGKISRELYEYRKAKPDQGCSDFLTVGSMGHASSIAMGLSSALDGRRVICLDGDGSVIMHMGSMAIIGQKASSNLIHVVLNNGAHDSVGGQPTVGFGIDLVGIAESCGYRRTALACEAEDVSTAMKDMRQAGGPCFLEVRVNRGSRENLGRPESTTSENREAFMRTCQSRK